MQGLLSSGKSSTDEDRDNDGDVDDDDDDDDEGQSNLSKTSLKMGELRNLI